MNETYFILNNIKYIVYYNDEKILFYKEIDNKKELLSNNEIISILNIKDSYIYNSEILINLLENNAGIPNKNYYYNFLEWLEKIIPVGYRDNFYRNLSTLKIEARLDLNFNEEVDLNNSDRFVGGYNAKENKIKISDKALKETWIIAIVNNKQSNPIEFYYKHLALTILHELAHMASTKTLDNKILCGFDVYPYDKLEDCNRGLTEGLTELIAMTGVPGTVELASGYFIEVSIINQLIQIIGLDVLLKSYFGNLGIKPLREKLNNIINDSEKSFSLFRNIELNFRLKNNNAIQTILGNIELSLLDYLDKKLESIKDKEEINKILNVYEQMLITPEKLKLMQKNPDNYVGIEDAITRFNSIKEKYSKELTIK